MKTQTRPAKPASWHQPTWMAPYVPLLRNTGGTFEDPAVAMNCDARNCNVVVNAPRAMLCIAVQSQVRLLELMHARGLLADAGAGKERGDE